MEELEKSIYINTLFDLYGKLLKGEIDYIFTSNDLAVHSADIPAIVSSDHRPYVAEIEI